MDSIKIILIIVVICMLMLVLPFHITAGMFLGAILIMLILSGTKEYFDTPRPVTNNIYNNFDSDDREQSVYGNISVKNDIDSIAQRSADLDFNENNSEMMGIDNSDMINSVVSKHSSTFQPNNLSGVTATSSALHSAFTLAQPDQYMGGVKYTTPLNENGYNADEGLARKQQHRGAMNKKAIDGAVRSTKNIYKKYFTNELDEQENKDWWSAEAAPMESDFRAYQ